MKQVFMIALLLGILGISLYAHPANKVTASYDAKTALLTVEFEHKVSNATDHFVYNITIQLNGKKTIEQVLTLQESTDGGSFVYKIPGLKKGDKINVVSDCNKGGKKSTTITIP
ncbi:MAG: hypothetical protein U1C33_08845 [Candidatus Cloacimonadaceae bacterium]|nr:hypothetical protein [Candidatus Cloacimonadaceae bacterium]